MYKNKLINLNHFIRMVDFVSVFQILLNKIALELTSHAFCVLNGKFSVLGEHPTIRIDCDSHDFQQNLVFGVEKGCATFIVAEDCTNKFLEKFLLVHDLAISIYERKTFVIIDYEGNMKNTDVLNVLDHEKIKRWLPSTIILQPNDRNNTKWINIWTAFPFSTINSIRNRFYLNNFKLERKHTLVPNVKNLEGIEIVTPLLSNPPFVSINKVKSGEGNANQYGVSVPLTIKLGGSEGTVMIEFCKKFNCTISARLEYDETSWGTMYANHTGTGCMGAIVKYEGDLTGSSLYLNLNRFKIIQYSHYTENLVVLNVVPKPKPLPFFYTPILPFPDLLWICVGLIIIGGTIVIFILNQLQTRFLPISEISNKRITCIDFLFTVLKMSLFQNTKLSSTTITNTVFYSIFLLYSVMIGNFYLSGLSSTMTVTPYEPPIDTVEKLVNTPWLKWGGPQMSFTYAIKDSEDPIHKKYVANFIDIINTKSFNLVKTQQMAIALDASQLGTVGFEGFIDESDSKFLMISKEPLYKSYSGIITSRTWPYIEQLNEIIYMQTESGLRRRWEEDAVYKSMNYKIQRNLVENMRPPGNSEPVKLSVDHIIGAIIFLAFGYIFATIIFLIEIFYNKSTKKLLNIKEMLNTIKL